MYHKILVPLDGSTLAESVLPQVEGLARRFNSHILLLRSAWAHSLPGLDETQRQLRAVQEAEEYVATIERRLRVAGVDVESSVWYADPSEAILEHASWHQVDLIAMSTHGRAGLERLFVGSVATKVLQGARVPVLVHRPDSEDDLADRPYRRILVPLDGSEFAETVLPEVAALAKAVAAEVILLQVVPSHVLADQTLVTLRKSLAKERLKVVDYLEQVERHLSDQGIVTRWIVRPGSAADEIVSAAQQQAADLIAMSTHGRSGVGRLIRGSVADAVVRAATVPVLISRSAARAAVLGVAL